MTTNNVDPDTLVTQDDLAHMLKISRFTLIAWRKRHASFPVPIVYGVKGKRRDSPNWVWGEVFAWMEQYRPHLLHNRRIELPAQVPEDE